MCIVLPERWMQPTFGDPEVTFILPSSHFALTRKLAGKGKGKNLWP